MAGRNRVDRDYQGRCCGRDGFLGDGYEGDNWRMDGVQGNPDFNEDCLGRVNVWCWEMDGSRGG